MLMMPVQAQMLRTEFWDIIKLKWIKRKLRPSPFIILWRYCLLIPDIVSCVHSGIPSPTITGIQESVFFHFKMTFSYISPVSFFFLLLLLGIWSPNNHLVFIAPLVPHLKQNYILMSTLGFFSSPKVLLSINNIKHHITITNFNISSFLSKHL